MEKRENINDLEQVAGDRNYFVIQDRGEALAIRRLSIYRHKVQVRCGCKDFYFRFGWYLKTNNAFYGSGPKPYQRKTTWWPSVNPQKIPGMCKHLWNVVYTLSNSKYIILFDARKRSFV